MAPLQVGRKLYRSVIIVTIGRTNSHCLDFLDAAYLVYDDVQCLHSSLYIVIDIVVSLSLNGGGHLDVAAAVHDTEY